MKAARIVITLSVVGLLGGLLAWGLAHRTSLAQDEPPGGFGGGWEAGPLESFEQTAAKLAGRPQVWVEAVFVQLDTAELDRVRSAVNNTLEAQTGKVMLDGLEKNALLAALRKQPSFEALGSAALVTISGQVSLFQMVEEVRYPVEYEVETDAQEDGSEQGPGTVLPDTYETRQVGMRLTVTPAVMEDGTTIALSVLPEVSLMSGWVTFGSEVTAQPVFTAWNYTATIFVQDGTTLVLKGVRSNAFNGMPLPGKQREEVKNGDRSALLLISAKIIH